MVPASYDAADAAHVRPRCDLRTLLAAAALVGRARRPGPDRAWRRSCDSRTSRRAAPGTATRATTCSCCAGGSRTASSRSSARRRRSATSTTGPVLLPPGARRVPDRRRLAAGRRVGDRPGGHRRGRVTWWLARSIAGPVAGLVAGLLLAVSTSAVDGSTFIWNPNLIALSSAVALAGAWQAWRTGDRGGGSWRRGDRRHGPVPRPGGRDGAHRGALLVADWRGRPAERRTAVARGPRLGWSSWPSATCRSRSTSSHATSRRLEAALAYLRGGGDAPAGPLARFPIVVRCGSSRGPWRASSPRAVVPALLAAVAVVARGHPALAGARPGRTPGRPLARPRGPVDGLFLTSPRRAWRS